MGFICFLCMLGYQIIACLFREDQSGIVFISRLAIVVLYAIIGTLVRNVMPTLSLCAIAVCSITLYTLIVWRLIKKQMNSLERSKNLLDNRW